MAELVQCSQCDGLISVLAELICPHCGCPANIALTPSKAAETKTSEKSDTQNSYIVAATNESENTRPFKHHFKSEFNLNWDKHNLEWKGSLDSEKRVQDFIDFCEENNVGYRAPSLTRRAEAPSPNKTVQSDSLPPSNTSAETQNFYDHKNKIPEDMRRKTKEGIGGTREDWKKNRSSNAGDMGYGKSR